MATSSGVWPGMETDSAQCKASVVLDETKERAKPGDLREKKKKAGEEVTASAHLEV